MALLDPLYRICNKPIFDSRRKMPIHILQVVLIIIAVGLTAPRLFIKNPRPTRAATMALAMGAKSLGFLAYMILTETTQRFKRWHSYKANVVLSCLDVVFWAVVPGLVLSAVVKQCTGVTCGLSWAVIIVAIIIQVSIVFTSAIAIREFREYKHGGIAPGPIVNSSTLPTPHKSSHHDVEMIGQVPIPAKAAYIHSQRQDSPEERVQTRQHRSERRNSRGSHHDGQQRHSGSGHHHRSERRLSNSSMHQHRHKSLISESQDAWQPAQGEWRPI